MNTGKEHILQSKGASRPIYSITPFTLLDFPDKAACILWFAGCNMRCLYCYNPAIVTGKGKITFKEALDFIHSRKNLLDGVVLSGGECTSHRNIGILLKEIKQAGFQVKIDTNGSNPGLLRKMVEERLVDYIALDYKAPPAKFDHITQSDLHPQFEETLRFLAHKEFPFEVRTTLHSDLLTSNDLEGMSRDLFANGYRGKYYLQHFVNDVETLGSLRNSQKRSFDLGSIKTELELVVRN